MIKKKIKIRISTIHQNPEVLLRDAEATRIIEFGSVC